MTTATVTNARSTERTVKSWLAPSVWAIVLGAASGSACVAVRLFFRLLQWVFVQQTGMLPIAAATLPPARRILTPVIGAALATLVVWMMRRWAPDLRFEDYVEAVRLRNGRIPLLSTVWRTVSSAFSVATGAGSALLLHVQGSRELRRRSREGRDGGRGRRRVRAVRHGSARAAVADQLACARAGVSRGAGAAHELAGLGAGVQDRHARQLAKFRRPLHGALK